MENVGQLNGNYTTNIVLSVALEQLPDDEDCCRKTNDDTDQRDDGFVGERHAV